MQRWLSSLMIIMLSTAVAGELKITPFLGSFRFSMGSAVFFFLILWLKPKHLSVVGLLVGLFVSLYRLGLDLFNGTDLSWNYFVSHHVPSIFFYIAFTILLQGFNYRKWLSLPIVLGGFGGLIDFGSNFVELLVRKMVEGGEIDFLSTLPTLLLVGFIRSFLVVGFYTMIEFRQLEAVSKEQKKRMDKLLFIATELHEESMYLQKMMKNVEEITVKSYKLSQRMLNDPLGMELLRLTEEIHEVKKDTQRIHAGISNLIKQEATAGYMLIEEVADVAMQSNLKYAVHQEKLITIRSECWVSLKTSHYFSILSLLNNIVSNSVEAIIYEGAIEILIYRKKQQLVIQVKDDGPGIASNDRELIFKPGFTTKYDQDGNSSTGIGLSHVQTIVNNLSGSIHVGKSEKGGALFRITLPIRVIEYEDQS